MRLNKNYINISTLTIDGTLIIDESFDLVEIYARNINIRGGKLIAGSETEPFPGKIKITLVENTALPNGINYVYVDDYL